MLDTLRAIIYFLTSAVFLFWLKIVFLSISAILFIAIIILLIRTKWMKKRFIEDFVEISTYRPYGTKKTFKQWNKLVKRMETEKETEYKAAIADADVLLRDILVKMGYKGESTREVLEKIDNKILPNIQDVWQAHEIRNKIIHDPDYGVTPEMAKKVMRIYEQSFRDLEMF